MPQPANREGVRRVGVTVTGEDYIVDSGSGFVHTFHRSTSSVGLAGADGEFPVTRAATELMHACEETIHYVFPLLCGFFLVSVHPSGPRLAASRWVKASYRWSGFDL